MSVTPEENTNNTERSALQTKNLKVPHQLTAPEQINSTHVDNVLVAIDHSTQIVTLTLMSSHPIPKYSNGWNLDNYNWNIVGEIKMPVNIMNAMAGYYFTAMADGIDVIRLIQLEMQKQKKQSPSKGISYGPFGHTVVKEQVKEQRNDTPQSN